MSRPNLNKLRTLWQIDIYIYVQYRQTKSKPKLRYHRVVDWSFTHAEGYVRQLQQNTNQSQALSLK